MSSPMGEAVINFTIDAFAEIVRDLASQLRGETAQTLGSRQEIKKNALS